MTAFEVLEVFGAISGLSDQFINGVSLKNGDRGLGFLCHYFTNS